MGFKVNRVMCDTCIFGTKSPISPERFAELEQVWANENRVQECHHATIQGKQIGCRGHYEAARRGEMSHPITDIAERALGLRDLAMPDLMQILERMGLIEFVEVDNA